MSIPPGDRSEDEVDYLSGRSPGSTTFADEDEPEPLSFAPNRLRRSSFRPAPGSVPPPSGLPPSSVRGSFLPPPITQRAGGDGPPSARTTFLPPPSTRLPPPDNRLTPPSSRLTPPSSVLPPPSSRLGPPSGLLPPPTSRKPTSLLPPPSNPPVSSSGLRVEFEVVSSRFGHPQVVTQPDGDLGSAWFDVRQAILETSGELRRRALVANDTGEQARFIGHAESLDKLLAYPLAAEYLLQPGVAAGLLEQLRRLKAAERAWPDEREYRDILLKAAATSIHLAPCLGYWQSCADVPARVRRLLTNEAVYSSVLEISKTRKSREVDRFISSYTSVVGGLARVPELNLQVRKPIIWPWCRYAIDKVAYTFRSPGERARDRRLEEAFADIKLLQVLFNVFADDAADNVQDPALVRLIGRIPTAGGRFGVARPEDYAALRAKLRAIGREEFEGYFDLAVDVWRYTLEQTRALAKEAYADHEPALAHDYKRIIDSMVLSVDLNTRPLDVFHLGPDAFADRYGGRDFGETLAHNSNRVGFYTMDLLHLRAQDPARYAELSQAGAFPVYARLAALFQEMHQTCNSLATGAREAESDDVSNELFKIANERLNATLDWQMPAALAKLLGPARHDVLIRAFSRKKEVRRRRALAPVGSDAHREAFDEYIRLSDGIEELIDSTDSQRRYFEVWLARRTEAAALVEQIDLPDGAALLAGNDLLLVLHLIYKGKI
ncbi:MAG: hypothetical protein QM820_56055 [Minicystis sp.]